MSQSAKCWGTTMIDEFLAMLPDDKFIETCREMIDEMEIRLMMNEKGELSSEELDNDN